MPEAQEPCVCVCIKHNWQRVKLGKAFCTTFLKYQARKQKCFVMYKVQRHPGLVHFCVQPFWQHFKVTLHTTDIACPVPDKHGNLGVPIGLTAASHSQNQAFTTVVWHLIPVYLLRK